MSVVGLGNHEALAEGLNPPLTTMALPHEPMGYWAVSTRLDLVEDREQRDGPFEPHKAPCPPVVRSSVASP